MLPKLSFSPNNKSEFISYTAGESLRTLFKARDAFGVISSKMDQNSEKDNYALAPVEDEEFLLTDPENPSTSLPHEETTDGDARPKRTIKPTLKLLENRFISDKEKLEKMWVDTAAAISKLW